MILAHNYGIDEGVTILVPLVLFALILRAGRRRQAAEEESAEAVENGGDPGDAGDRGAGGDVEPAETGEIDPPGGRTPPAQP